MGKFTINGQFSIVMLVYQRLDPLAHRLALARLPAPASFQTPKARPGNDSTELDGDSTNRNENLNGG